MTVSVMPSCCASCCSGSFSDDEQAHIVLRFHLLCPEAQQHVHTFFPSQSADKAGDSGILRNVVLFADLCALLRCGGLWGKGVQFHRIGDDLHLLVAADFIGILLAFFGRSGHHSGILREHPKVAMGQLFGQRNQRLWCDVVDVVIVHGVQGVHQRHLEDFGDCHTAESNAKLVVDMDDVGTKFPQIF